MSFKSKDSDRAVLRKLWGRNVPPLTSEEIDLSVQAWQKIKTRKQQQKSEQEAKAN